MGTHSVAHQTPHVEDLTHKLVMLTLALDALGDLARAGLAIEETEVEAVCLECREAVELTGKLRR